MKISGLAKRAEIEGVERLLKKIPPPWDNFRIDLKKTIQNIIVSHRSDHGKIITNSKDLRMNSTSGKLFNETALGIIDSETVVSRVPLINLERKDIVKSDRGKNIRDSNLQIELKEVTDGKSGSELKKSLIEFSQKKGHFHGIRHVRVVEKISTSARKEIKNHNGEKYKAYKKDSNHCIEFWKLPDGKIKSIVISTINAHSNKIIKPHPAAKKLFRIFKRDMVIIEDNGKSKVCYVQKFNINKEIYLAEHFEANTAARNQKNKFKFIRRKADIAVKNYKFRRVIVNEIGQLTDPGVKYLK